MRLHREPAGPVLRAPKTAELIASYIRGQVVRGDLKTGDSLPSETVLMEMFGVSRPTCTRRAWLPSPPRRACSRPGAPGRTWTT